MSKPHLRGRNKKVNPLLGEPMDDGTEALKGIGKAASSSSDRIARGSTSVPNYDGTDMAVGNSPTDDVSFECVDLLKPIKET